MLKFIKDVPSLKSLVIERNNEGFSIYSAFSSISKFYGDYHLECLKKRKEQWNIHDWTCRLKKIRVWIQIFELEEAFDIITEASDVDDVQLGFILSEYSRLLIRALEGRNPNF